MAEIKVGVRKNPKNWSLPYRVEVRKGKGRSIASQHKTKRAALTEKGKYRKDPEKRVKKLGLYFDY